MSTKAVTTLVAGAVMLALVAGVLVAMAPRGSTISGIGNSANRIYADPTRDELAELLVTTGAAPAVGAEELASIYAGVAARARAGDLDAALVVLQVAARQRRARTAGAH